MPCFSELTLALLSSHWNSIDIIVNINYVQRKSKAKDWTVSLWKSMMDILFGRGSGAFCLTPTISAPRNQEASGWPQFWSYPRQVKARQSRSFSPRELLWWRTPRLTSKKAEHFYTQWTYSQAGGRCKKSWATHEFSRACWYWHICYRAPRRVRLTQSSAAEG